MRKTHSVWRVRAAGRSSIVDNIAMPLTAVLGLKRKQALEATRTALEEARLWR